jgi:hypothetical protein
LPSQGIEVPSATVGSVRTGRTAIQEVLVGQVTIDEVRLDNCSGDFNYKSGTLEKAQMDIRLEPSVDYWWGVSIDIFWDTIGFGGQGTIPLPAIDTGMIDLGDLGIAGGKLNFDMKKITFGPFRLTPSPIREVEVESVTAREVSLKSVAMTTSLPALGLTLPVPNPAGSETAKVAVMQVGEASARSISLPPLSFRQIRAPNISADAMKADGFTAAGSKTVSTGWVPSGPDGTGFGVRLSVDVKVTLKAAKLDIKGLSGEVAVDSASTSRFSMSLSMNEVYVDGMDMQPLQVPTIDLEV